MQESDLLNLGFKRITMYDPRYLEHPEWHYYELSIGDLDIMSCSNYILRVMVFGMCILTYIIVIF
jgi:hypothetical protein